MAVPVPRRASGIPTVHSMHSNVQERAEALAGKAFLGGPVEDFEEGGRLQLVTLLREGLQPNAKVLDVGCGCLRGGYWTIHFLDPECYFGIEPAREVLEVGLDRILEPGLEEAKRPRFASNDDWDFSGFGVKFDFVIARSVWSHASKAQIKTMLDSFMRSASPGGKMLVSYLPSGWGRYVSGGQRGLRLYARDYKGDEWVGRDHEGSHFLQPGLTRGKNFVNHSRRWILAECRSRGLTGRELPYGQFHRQRWLCVSSDHPEAQSANGRDQTVPDQSPVAPR